MTNYTIKEASEARNVLYFLEMIVHILLDFSRVMLFPKDKNYSGKLNDLYRKAVREKSFNFFSYFELNEELVQYINRLKSKFIIHILTTDIIQNDPAIKTVLSQFLSNVFVANDLGMSKKNPDTYTFLAQKLHCLPEQILLIDDSITNIEAAKKAGLQAIQYISNQQIIEDFKKLFKDNGLV